MSQQPITITILNDDVDDDIVKALRDMEKEIKEAIIESIYGPPRDKINRAMAIDRAITLGRAAESE